MCVCVCVCVCVSVCVLCVYVCCVCECVCMCVVCESVCVYMCLISLPQIYSSHLRCCPLHRDFPSMDYVVITVLKITGHSEVTHLIRQR